MSLGLYWTPENHINKLSSEQMLKDSTKTLYVVLSKGETILVEKGAVSSTRSEGSLEGSFCH